MLCRGVLQTPSQMSITNVLTKQNFLFPFHLPFFARAVRTPPKLYFLQVSPSPSELFYPCGSHPTTPISCPCDSHPTPPIIPTAPTAPTAPILCPCGSHPTPPKKIFNLLIPTLLPLTSYLLPHKNFAVSNICCNFAP